MRKRASMGEVFGISDYSGKEKKGELRIHRIGRAFMPKADMS